MQDLFTFNLCLVFLYASEITAILKKQFIATTFVHFRRYNCKTRVRRSKVRL